MCVLSVSSFFEHGIVSFCEGETCALRSHGATLTGLLLCFHAGRDWRMAPTRTTRTPAPSPAVQIDGRGSRKMTDSHVAAVYERTPFPGRNPLRPLNMTHRHRATVICCLRFAYMLRVCKGRRSSLSSITPLLRCSQSVSTAGLL